MKKGEVREWPRDVQDADAVEASHLSGGRGEGIRKKQVMKKEKKKIQGIFFFFEEKFV